MKRNLTLLFSMSLIFCLSLVATAKAQQSREKIDPPNSRGTIIHPETKIPANSFRIIVPFEKDDLGSNFHIENGSVLTAITSMGSFTARDTAIRAVIPYYGEATLKFTSGLVQEWTPPNGITLVEILKMHRDPKTGLREFYSDEPSIYSFSTSGGQIKMPSLPIDEYMIRGRYKNGNYLYLPLSVRPY